MLEFHLPHCVRMSLLVKKDEAADPVHVGFFGAIGIVSGAQGFGELIEQFFCHEN